MPWLLAGGGVIVVLLAIPPIWEFTNSPKFCGEVCHTMPPQFSTYLVSPHARVACVDCHIGRDLIIVQATRKVGHLRLVAATVLDNYELPIMVSDMRPARETCEQCHFPEKFSDDSLRVINTYANDRDNTPYDIYMLMHTGGGSERQGLAKGIHWHTESKVSFIATDRLEQDIPWVRVEEPDGTITEYNAINSPIDTQNLEQYTTRDMDCITCHNRIAHEIENPETLVDNALRSGDLSDTIPFIRTRAVDLLTSTSGETESQANHLYASLDQYYRDNYGDFYASGKQDVENTITLLTSLHDESNFPDQKLTSSTHPNNVGHLNSPGCFRCHDGQHFSSDGKVIRLECNLCHSIPLVVKSGTIEPLLRVATGIEPSSHLDPSWISRHHNTFDATCSNCHTTNNPGGTDNSSFCSNSACHGAGWKYAGFDAPGLATMLKIYQYTPEPLLEDFTGVPTYNVLQPMFVQVCGGCHGPVPTKGLRLTDFQSAMTGSESGAVIVPGAPEQSLIIEVLDNGHFASLSKHQMELLIQWITDGAPEV
ncbi:MAG: NapC/NirT family cytochrome c [Anaerolineae bacterium]